MVRRATPTISSTPVTRLTATTMGTIMPSTRAYDAW
jgi:hypothetical protein